VLTRSILPEDVGRVRRFAARFVPRLGA
jgi:hypothetical protein